jgi:NADPH:quinone reductase-like Zn-dependent oxidoreductase
VKALVYKSFGGPSVLGVGRGLGQTCSKGKPRNSKCGSRQRKSKRRTAPERQIQSNTGERPATKGSGDRHRRRGGLEIDKNVVDITIGDLIFGMTNRFSGGVHAEYAVFDESEIARAPSNISSVIASCVPLSAQTAIQALRDHCKVAPGHKVLINGASGGVGHFAVQIAKALGAEVHAVCGSSHLDFVAALGADMVHDYAVEPAPQIASTFHCVFDVFGRFSRKDFAKQLGRKGVFVSTVPKVATFRGELLARVGLDQRSRLVQVKSCTSDLNQLREWIELNRLVPHVEKIYPITAAQDAHRHIESKHTTGKIVLSF